MSSICQVAQDALAGPAPQRRSGGDAQWTTLRRASWPVFSARAAQLSRARGDFGLGIYSGRGRVALSREQCGCLCSLPSCTVCHIDPDHLEMLGERSTQTEIQGTRSAQFSAAQLSALGAHTAQYPLAVQHSSADARHGTGQTPNRPTRRSLPMSMAAS